MSEAKKEKTTKSADTEAAQNTQLSTGETAGAGGAGSSSEELAGVKMKSAHQRGETFTTPASRSGVEVQREMNEKLNPASQPEKEKVPVDRVTGAELVQSEQPTGSRISETAGLRRDRELQAKRAETPTGEEPMVEAAPSEYRAGDSKAKAADQPATRVLAKGTSLMMGDQKITLEADAEVSYPRAGDEAKFVAMCALSDNTKANAKNFRFRYDSLGRRLELREQVDRPEDLPRFVSKLSRQEASDLGVAEADHRAYMEMAKAESGTRRPKTESTSKKSTARASSAKKSAKKAAKKSSKSKK